MSPRYQDDSFQPAADMLRNQQREFVEPLMQQMAANLGLHPGRQHLVCCWTSSSGRTEP